MKKLLTTTVTIPFWAWVLICSAEYWCGALIAYKAGHDNGEEDAVRNILNTENK